MIQNKARLDVYFMQDENSRSIFWHLVQKEVTSMG